MYYSTLQHRNIAMYHESKEAAPLGLNSVALLE